MQLCNSLSILLYHFLCYRLKMTNYGVKEKKISCMYSCFRRVIISKEVENRVFRHNCIFRHTYVCINNPYWQSGRVFIHYIKSCLLFAGKTLVFSDFTALLCLRPWTRSRWRLQHSHSERTSCLREDQQNEIKYVMEWNVPAVVKIYSSLGNYFWS